MKIAIVDYGSGNLRSAAKAFERAARESESAADIVVTSQPAVVSAADRVVLPGVGAFADCMGGLIALGGMVDALYTSAIIKARPFLGICVGMQLMATIGREHGEHAGLGWIEGEVAALKPNDPTLKIPHMGWNNVRLKQPDHPLFAGIESGQHAYFVHSYAFRPQDRADILADTDYGGAVVAAIGRDNMAGTQFHPEKSQALGLRLIANFLSWSPG